MELRDDHSLKRMFWSETNQITGELVFWKFEMHFCGKE